MNSKLILAAVGAACAITAGASPAPNLDDFEWYDGKALTVEGMAFADTAEDAPYGRLPRSAKDAVPEAVWRMSRESMGVNVRFLTEGDGKGHRIMFKWEVTNPDAADAFAGPVGMTGLSVYRREADGTWQFAAAPRYIFYSREHGGEYAMNWPMGKACMVYLPMRTPLKSFKVGVEKGCKLKPMPRHPVARRVVHYGTSIVHGGCVSQPGLAFASREGRLADVEVINQGYSGSGKMEMSMCEVVASIDAALYIVDCDWNMDVPMQKERYEPFVRELRKRRPTTPILLCGGCTQFAKPRAQEVFAKGVYDKLKAEDPALWKDLHFLSGVGMLPQDGEPTFDFCHPNDYGAMQMGRVYADKIREILETKQPDGTQVLQTSAKKAAKAYREIADLPVACREVEAVPGKAASYLPTKGKFTLVWHDEFDGDALDETKWSYRTNFWGRSAHWFATPADNAVEVKDGLLRLKLVKRADGQFVSPQLQTGELMWDVPALKNPKGFWPLSKREPAKYLKRYGYFECRARLQKMPGWWSAFWMQTESQGCTLDPARSGLEHDIMESFDPGEVLPSCFHYNGYGPDYQGFRIPDVKKNDDSILKVGTDGFHVYGMLWTEDGYVTYVDGRLRGRSAKAVSQVPEFVLLTTEAKWYRNDRMTGKGVPELEATAAAGDDFVVDYVRVFDVSDAAPSDPAP